ncbi:MAG: hypothetical protein K2H85_08415, partial [Allobaculum sp.]|nr:hypothetical protein [Allobaculum sp.]
MIFQLNKDFVDSLSGEDLSEFCSKIVKGLHFLCAENSDTLMTIKTAIESHGSSKQKRLFKSYNRFKPTSLQRKYYMTYTPCVGCDMVWLEWLAEKPGYLIMENSHNEWDVYKFIIEAYKNDREFGNLYKELKNACDEYRIEPRHGGGSNGLISEKNRITPYPKQGYTYVNLKSLILFDRDTNDHTYYDINKNKLFKHLCRKNHTTIRETDIYSLNQPAGNWHMWYKRAIENYFDDECYSKSGIGPVEPAGCPRDYFKIDDGSVSNYEKNKLSVLASHASRERLENGLMSFYCPISGHNIS